MVTIKTPEEIEILKEGGKRHALILRELAAMVAPGLSTDELDRRGRELIAEGGDKPAFLNYKPAGAKRPYPAAVCVSVNDEVVHGIPNENPIVLKEGDIVSIDIGLIHKGLITDAAVTVPVGKVAKETMKLLTAAKEALMKGIKEAKAEQTTGDIGYAISEHLKPLGFGIVQELCGHGVGYSVHEDPFVPNFGVKGRGARLKPGMVIAIEPMVNIGGKDIKLDKDGYTYRTKDGSLSAHFEHTVVITEGAPIVVTAL